MLALPAEACNAATLLPAAAQLRCTTAAPLPVPPDAAPEALFCAQCGTGINPKKEEYIRGARQWVHDLAIEALDAVGQGVGARGEPST